MIRQKLKQLALVLVCCLPFGVSADVTNIDNEKLEQLREQGVAIIDVRRVDEWQETGVIEGSHAITFFDAKGNYNVDDWLSKVSDIAQSDQPIVLICAQGVRTSKIAEFLDKRLGFTQVRNVTEGISAWIEEGHPVVEWTP